MLVSLLATLFKTPGAAVASFFTGARASFRPHAPEASPYLSEEWANPQGAAPNRTLEIVLDQPGVAVVTRQRRPQAEPRTITAEAAWHAAALFDEGMRAKVSHWSFEVAAGQAVDVSGARATLQANPAEVVESWSAVAAARAKRRIVRQSRVVEVSAGATATFAAADFNQIVGNSPDVTGIRNPSPAEIIAMVQASLIVRQNAR